MNDGLDDLINHIDKMQKNAERLNGKNEFTNDELYSCPFMLQHTYLKKFLMMNGMSGLLIKLISNHGKKCKQLLTKN